MKHYTLDALTGLRFEQSFLVGLLYSFCFLSFIFS
jgi:hypothetical protein